PLRIAQGERMKLKSQTKSEQVIKAQSCCVRMLLIESMKDWCQGNCFTLTMPRTLIDETTHQKHKLVNNCITSRATLVVVIRTILSARVGLHDLGLIQFWPPSLQVPIDKRQ